MALSFTPTKPKADRGSRAHSTCFQMPVCHRLHLPFSQPKHTLSLVPNGGLPLLAPRTSHAQQMLRSGPDSGFPLSRLLRPKKFVSRRRLVLACPSPFPNRTFVKFGFRRHAPANDKFCSVKYGSPASMLLAQRVNLCATRLGAVRWQCLRCCHVPVRLSAPSSGIHIKANAWPGSCAGSGSSGGVGG